MASINIRFSYRTKFKKVLNRNNQQLIDEGFMKFCVLDLMSASKLLWDLEGKDAGTALKCLGLEIISEENISLLKCELRYQYERLHGKCFDANEIPEKWKQAYAELANNANVLVANAVFQRCQCTLKMGDYIIDRVLYLLNSDDERYYFGGLRQMGFDYKDSDYLKPYHQHVRQLLLVMRGDK